MARNHIIWSTSKKYKINANIIRVIENLYHKPQSAVLFNGSTGDWFGTIAAEIRERCLLSPTLFNILLERILCQALNDHESNVSIGEWLIINIRFADGIVVNAQEEDEADVLVDRLDTTTTRYEMEIVRDKTNVMTNDKSCFKGKIEIKGHRLGG